MVLLVDDDDLDWASRQRLGDFDATEPCSDDDHAGNAAVAKRLLPVSGERGCQVHRSRFICRANMRPYSHLFETDMEMAARVSQGTVCGAGAADLKFLHHLPQTRTGTSNRKAALES
jgi:hypothetical protein